MIPYLFDYKTSPKQPKKFRWSCKMILDFSICFFFFSPPRDYIKGHSKGVGRIVISKLWAIFTVSRGLFKSPAYTTKSPFPHCMDCCEYGLEYQSINEWDLVYFRIMSSCFSGIKKTGEDLVPYLSGYKTGFLSL